MGQEAILAGLPAFLSPFLLPYLVPNWYVSEVNLLAPTSMILEQVWRAASSAASEECHSSYGIHLLQSLVTSHS
jgi:hypothetical protein